MSSKDNDKGTASDGDAVKPVTDVTDYKQLTTIYKKNGSFDKQRKQLLKNFKQSETHSNLLLKLKLMIENKIKNDPSILMKNRGKMGALIQGEIINQHLNGSDDSNSRNASSTSSLLSIVDKDIQEKIIDSPEFHEALKVELKDIRRQLMGISDEEYVKILEQEQAARNKELEELALKNEEREHAYKNNFKVKNLNHNHKISKPPRFNFGAKNGGKSVRDTNGSSSNGSNGNNKKPTYLMY